MSAVVANAVVEVLRSSRRNLAVPWRALCPDRRTVGERNTSTVTTEGASAMRGLMIGIALAAIVFLATGGHFLLIPLLIPLGFFAFLRKRAGPA
jgi:hypothetical protein